MGAVDTTPLERELASLEVELRACATAHDALEVVRRTLRGRARSACDRMQLRCWTQVRLLARRQALLEQQLLAGLVMPLEEPASAPLAKCSVPPALELEQAS
jgi:hypothetical protein